jgi:isochorismate synthase EntC
VSSSLARQGQARRRYQALSLQLFRTTAGPMVMGGGLFASEKYRAEHKRVVEKIQAHGVAVDTGLKLKVRRWLYKLDMRRHLRWLLVQ